jgi:hypothetical protein
MSDTAFYTREGSAYVPTGLGISPWNDRAQAGVAVAGLAVHLLEAVPDPVPMTTARLTIDILGAVPFQRLEPTVTIVREGKRVRMVEVELSAEGRAWVRARALRSRTADSPERRVPLTRPLPEQSNTSFGSAWADMVRINGDFRKPGPGAAWVRMKARVLADEPLQPLVALAMAADFGSGVAPTVAMSEWTFANVDISIHLTRPPEGEWLLLDATSESAGNGVGLIHNRLGDQHGMIGMASANASSGGHKMSGIGRERGVEGIRAFQEIQVMNLGTAV